MSLTFENLSKFEIEVQQQGPLCKGFKDSLSNGGLSWRGRKELNESVYVVVVQF